ncbi:MAG: DUF748 domain-containing protein [Steroidobacteraceae bacterium]
MPAQRIKLVAFVTGALVALVGLYAWAGYRLAPRLIAEKLPAAIEAATGQRLTLGAVAVDPFALSVDVTGLALTGPDGSPLLGAGRLFIDAEIASLWRRSVVLRSVVLDEPSVDLVLRKDGQLNLVAALTPKSRAAPAGEARKPLRVSVGEIIVNRGRLDASDLRRPVPLHERVAPINVRVQDFTTAAGAAGRFEIVGRGGHGASLTLDGRIATQPFALDGWLTVRNLPAETAWRLAGSYDRIAPPSGEIDVAMKYQVASGAAGVRIDLAALDIDARALAVRAPGADSDWIRIAGLAARGGSIAVHDSLVRLPDVAAQGLEVHAWSGEDGRLNLAALAPPAPPPDSQAGTAATAQDTAPHKGWRIEAPRLRIAASRIEYEDRGAPSPVGYRLAPFELEVDGYASDTASVKTVLRSGFNDTGRIAVEGAWRPGDAGGEFTVDAERLPVPFLQPYLERRTDLVLKDGTLSAKGDVRIARPAGGAPRVEFDGGATLTGFRSVDRALQEDFVRFGALSLAGIRYRTSPASLRVHDVHANGAYFKLVIAPDRTTNIADVLSPPRLRARAGDGDAAAAQAHTHTVDASTDAPRRMPMRIDRIRIERSSANFADLSIRPHFATGILDLAGTVSGLSSDPDARAAVKLDGKVDRYAPVEIRGSANWLATSSYTHLEANFHNIELPTFTPYSGKFMGYKIEKGKLDAQFSYLIEHRRLDAKHRFVLDGFTLGERVDSADAVHLPVKLAVALLKDRNGVIDIDLPVSGSLDDPQFRVGPLVWKALKNLLVKIATAPFALIGSLFGAGEEVRFVDFAYGSAALDAPAQERLASVGKALTDRPQLALEVPLAVDGAHDRAALVEQRFDAMVGGAASRGLRDRDPAAWQKALDAAWREATGERHAPRPERAQDEDAGSWAQRVIAADEAALRARIVIPDTGLAALARARADAVRDALVAGGLAPERVFIVTGEPAADATGRVRLALEVK